jgi:transcriptional regulator with XRE-family HTH domain
MKLHEQIKQRRRQLGFKQTDMKMRIAMNQQQYQRIEAGGNANLDSIQRIAEGLNAELMLIPKDKLAEVRTILERNSSKEAFDIITNLDSNEGRDIWKDLLNKDKS